MLEVGDDLIYRSEDGLTVGVCLLIIAHTVSTRLQATLGTTDDIIVLGPPWVPRRTHYSTRVTLCTKEEVIVLGSPYEADIVTGPPCVPHQHGHLGEYTKTIMQTEECG